MAHTKAGGTAKNLRDSNPKFLGIKLHDGEIAGIGDIIIRQRGTKILPGKNTGLSKDHTIFALKSGKVKFSSKRKLGFNNQSKVKKVVGVV